MPDVFCWQCGDADYGPWGFDFEATTGDKRLLCERCIVHQRLKGAVREAKHDMEKQQFLDLAGRVWDESL